MRHYEVFLAVMLLSLPVLAADHAVPARVATLTIDPREVTILNLRPEFESSIRMPEEVTSVILGSPGAFKAEHNEGEPQYVYVKPITKEPAQSNLLIATKSGQHVTIELISAGASAASDTPPVDFLIEYRTTRSFLVAGDTPGPIAQKTTDKGQERKMSSRPAGLTTNSSNAPRSALDEVFAQQAQINAPEWTKWEGRQIETSVGGVRQWKNETVVAYSIFNNSDASVEIVPPQIQIDGRKPDKKKSKKSKGILSDQMEIRDYKLSTTRLEPGARADGVVVSSPQLPSKSARDFGWRCQRGRTTHGTGWCWKERRWNQTNCSSSIGANDGRRWTANLNTSSNGFGVITQHVSVERPVDTPCRAHFQVWPSFDSNTRRGELRPSIGC